MKTRILTVALMYASLHLANASIVHADDAKVPDSVTEEVVEAEKQQSEVEESEEGEASGNVEDCDPVGDSDDAQDGVEQKDLDQCEELVK